MALHELKDFDFSHSTVTLWTFKGRVPSINGHWIDTTTDLDAEFQKIASAQLVGLEEEMEYTLLAENNEASVLTLPHDETRFYLVEEALSNRSYARKIRDVKTIQNAKFYVVEFVNNDEVVYAVRRTDKSWRTKEKTDLLTLIWKDKELDIIEDEGFQIHRSFDFFIFNNNIFIVNKGNFEIVMNYREAHAQDFHDLCSEPEFRNLFEELDVLISYVGQNKVQLRRMSAIRQKAFYKDADFMARLSAQFADHGLNLTYSGNGLLVPTPENCKDVLTALLDHRLRSSFSENTYDVQNATNV